MKVIEENGRPTAREKGVASGCGCGCDGGGMARETSAGGGETSRPAEAAPAEADRCHQAGAEHANHEHAGHEM